MSSWTIRADPDRPPRIEFDACLALTSSDIDEAVGELQRALDAAGITERPIDFWIGQKGGFGKTMRLNRAAKGVGDG